MRQTACPAVGGAVVIRKTRSHLGAIYTDFVFCFVTDSSNCVNELQLVEAGRER